MTTIRLLRTIAAVLLTTAAFALAASARTPEPPEHVQTSIQDLCYAPTCWHRSQAAVGLDRVATMVTWAFADAAVADAARRAGIRTIAYLDPSIQYDPTRDFAPLYADDESLFLHACDGRRASVRLGDLPGYFMDEAAPPFRARLAAYVTRSVRPHYDVLFVDDVFAATDTLAKVVARPCETAFARERSAAFGAWQAADMPIVFNGLGLAPDDGRPSDHALAAFAGPRVIGGMYEMCLTAFDPQTDRTLGHRRIEGAWLSIENSHLATVARQKMFFCFAESPLDGTSTEAAIERTYTYASFLLAYDLRYSVLQEALRSARSGVPVYPESRLVALDPRQSSGADIDALRRGTAYAREFARCYLARVPLGPCAVAVNPSGTADVPMPLAGYHHALALTGGSIADGGSAAFTAPVPVRLAPATGAIVIK